VWLFYSAVPQNTWWAGDYSRGADSTANHTEVEKRLWEAADELRANSKLKSSEYSVPVLGLIFLRYADQKFTEAEKKLTAAGSGRRKSGKTDYQA
jgi:type I restriction enzyme M protein